jgi:hypothetical protein
VSHLDNIKLKMIGHLKMIEYDSTEAMASGNGTVVMNRRNAINKENAALMFARAITNRPLGIIYYMAFGSGGATIDPLGNVILNPSIVAGGPNTNLYNPIFNVIVDDQSGVSLSNLLNISTGTGSENYKHTVGTEYTYANINAILGKNDPFGYLVVPSGENPTNGMVTFNEIGLKLADESLITHVTFTPIEKKSTVILQILYTLKISLSG